ncbi:hypothetical protein Ptr902_14031 (mitochondrion) [Pyrenophora tritici-repentis]|nr:hypothetical protein Ptr902_14031 [Pyrenophora tritici-repentis]
MAANVVEEQPAQAIADEFLDSSPEYQIPETKSSVSNKKVPNAVGQLSLSINRAIKIE